LGIENTKYRDPKKILEYFHSKMEEESFDGKDEAIPNLGKVVDVIKQFQKIKSLANNDHQLTQPLETYLSTLNH
jgi:hypothetical protein